MQQSAGSSNRAATARAVLRRLSGLKMPQRMPAERYLSGDCFRRCVSLALPPFPGFVHVQELLGLSPSANSHPCFGLSSYVRGTYVRVCVRDRDPYVPRRFDTPEQVQHLEGACGRRCEGDRAGLVPVPGHLVMESVVTS